MNSTLKPMPSQCVKTEKFNESDVETDPISVSTVYTPKNSMNPTLKPTPSQCVKTEKFNESDVETDALLVCENRKIQ